MKANGVVRRLAASPPGLERWEAQCLLCSWRSGGRRQYASKGAAELGIGMHLSMIHKLNLTKRRVEERSASHQSFSAWFRHEIHFTEIL